MIKHLILSSFVCVSTAALSIDSQHIKNVIFPGKQTSDLSDLNPDFRELSLKTIEELEKDGYQVNIRATYRDSEYQDFLYNVSQVTERFLSRSVTRSSGGNSRHNRQYNDQPGSCAVDVEATGLTMDQEAEFYKILIEVSRKNGLRTGGRYRKKATSVWSNYGLGWDPGHVYMTWGSCR